MSALAAPPAAAAVSWPRLLAISRGLGWSHAARTVRILDELRALGCAFEPYFASYGEGVEAIAAAGHQCVDLSACFAQGIPGSFGSVVSYIRALVALIRNIVPDYVLIYEEFHAVPLARGFGTPSVVVSDFLPPPASLLAACAKEAELIIVPDQEGAVPITEELAARVEFTGPIIKAVETGFHERMAMRQRICASPAEVLITVTTGSRAPLYPDDVSFFETIIEVAQALASGPAAIRFCVFSAAFEKLLRAPASRLPRFAVQGTSPELMATMAASDLVITRGGRNTLWELGCLGVPSISVPYGRRFNLFAELSARNMERLGTTTVLPEAELSTAALLDRIRALLERHSTGPQGLAARSLRSFGNGAAAAARLIQSVWQLPPAGRWEGASSQVPTGATTRS